MSKGKLLALAAASLVVLGATGASFLYLLDREEPLPPAPTLDLLSQFPAGFDRHHLTLKAVGYDGKSRCANVWKLESVTDQRWTSKGVRYTKVPSPQDMEDAQPLVNAPYEFVDETGHPYRADSVQLPVVRPASNCEVQYRAALWQAPAVAANEAPVTILDDVNRPYQYAATEVKLGGDGDGQGGTRFLLEGPGNATDTRLAISLFRPGEFHTDGRVYHNVSGEALDLGGRFAFVFDVPAIGLTDGTLVIMPLDPFGNVPDAVLGGTLSFDRLMRLQASEVQLYLGSKQLPEHPVVGDVLALGGVRAPSVAEAGRMARDQTLSEELGSLGNAMFLTQQAFEPRAQIADSRLVQATVDGTSATSSVLHLSGDGVSRETRATFKLVVTDAKTTFQVSVRDSPLAGKAASQAWEATAVLSRITADGATIVESASGDTVDAAVTTLHRSVSITGHQKHLDAALGEGRDLLRQADRAFLAAAVIASAWEFHQAEKAERPLERLEHRLRAGQFVVEAAFSMTIPGAVVVAASHLIVHVLAQHAAPGLVDDLATSIQRSSGEMSAHDANAAWKQAAPQIQKYAQTHDASFLEQHVHQTDPPPRGLARILLVGLGVVVVLGVLGMRR